MQLIITIDLAGAAFQNGNSGRETARILHSAAERLITLQSRYRAIDVENPEQLYLQDNTGALAGYVSTVEIDGISPAVQDRITHETAAAGQCFPGPASGDGPVFLQRAYRSAQDGHPFRRQGRVPDPARPMT